MSLKAALRHERENLKHIEKVQEKIRNDWNYDPPCDWGPIRLPEGSTAWEQSYPADRADDFINFWLANVVADERGEKPQTMDSFINNYNQKYQNWLDSWYTGEVQMYAHGHDDMEEEDGWNGVPGIWYDGGSFFPHEDGFNTVYHPSLRRTGDNWSAQPKDQWQPCDADPTSPEWVIHEDPHDEYLAWGFTPDERPPFQASDTTSPSQPQHASLQTQTRGRKDANGRRGKNHGQGRGEGFRKQGGRAADGATLRADDRRGQRAKIY